MEMDIEKVIEQLRIISKDSDVLSFSFERSINKVKTEKGYEYSPSSKYKIVINLKNR